MTFDFSHLTNTEEVSVTAPNGDVLFTAVVREITQGDRASAQREMFKQMRMKGTNKRDIEAAMVDAMQSGAALDSSAREEVAAIASWTLTDANGDDVPVCLEAWQALPRSLASQIEEVIERLNPALDDATKSQAGSDS